MIIPHGIKNGGAVLSSTIDKHIYITCRFHQVILNKNIE